MLWRYVLLNRIVAAALAPGLFLAVGCHESASAPGTCDYRADARPPPAGTYEIRLGVIGIEDAGWDVLDIPDTATVGSPLELTVRSFGNGCYSPHSITVDVRDRVATVIPYDRVYVLPPADPCADWTEVCTSALVPLVHEATVTFDSPGPAELRVIGRRDFAQERERIVEIVEPILVE